MFRVQPGGAGWGALWWGGNGEAEKDRGLREETGGGVGLPAAAPPHSGWSATPALASSASKAFL